MARRIGALPIFFAWRESTGYIFLNGSVLGRGGVKLPSWGYCYKFEEFEMEPNREKLERCCGVYRFGYFHNKNFMPRYIGRVCWTENKNTFLKRFQAYKNNPHNSEIAKRVAAERKGLWYQVMEVADPAWTESKYLLDDKNEFGQFNVYEWNSRSSYVAENRDKKDLRTPLADLYQD